MADAGPASTALGTSSPDRRRVNTVVLLAAGALVVVVAAAAVRPDSGDGRPGWLPRGDPALDITGDLPTGGPQSVWAPVFQVAGALLMLVLIVVMARRLLAHLAAIRRWRRDGARPARPTGQLRWGADPVSYDGALAAAALVGADDLGQLSTRATSSWEISDAVVAAWVRLESVAAGAGSRRRSHDTADEFAGQLMAGRLVDPDAITVLSGLYGRARFSDEQLHRADAVSAHQALTRVHRDLVTRAAPSRTP